MKKRRFAVLLTRGSDPKTYIGPDFQALIRADVVAQMLRSDPEMGLCIIGGYPDAVGKTLAERMEKYFGTKYPWLVDRIMVVDGSSNNTVDDLINLGKLLEQKGLDLHNTTLVLVSRQGHCGRMRWTVEAMGCEFEFHDSMEPVTLKEDIQDLVGFVVNFFDPFHEWYFGRKLRAMAEENAEKFRKRSEKVLFGENPQLDPTEQIHGSPL